jgi:hypothetical protein
MRNAERRTRNAECGMRNKRLADEGPDTSPMAGDLFRMVSPSTVRRPLRAVRGRPDAHARWGSCHAPRTERPHLSLPRLSLPRLSLPHLSLPRRSLLSRGGRLANSASFEHGELSPNRQVIGNGQRLFDG